MVDDQKRFEKSFYLFFGTSHIKSGSRISFLFRVRVLHCYQSYRGLVRPDVLYNLIQHRTRSEL